MVIKLRLANQRAPLMDTVIGSGVGQSREQVSMISRLEQGLGMERSSSFWTLARVSGHLLSYNLKKQCQDMRPNQGNKAEQHQGVLTGSEECPGYSWA